MSHADHEWTRDRLAAHAADGLSADERARLEAHLETCKACREELDDLRGLDASLGKLFTPVRSRAGMEERVIRALRTAPSKRTRGAGWRIITTAAAIFLTGLVGFVFTEMEEGRLVPSPRDPVALATPPPITRAEPQPAKALFGFDYSQLQGKVGMDYRDVDGDVGVLSVDQLARNQANGMLRALEKDGKLGLAGKDRGWGDRNETADEEEFSKAKGDSLDFVSDKPFYGKRATRLDSLRGPVPRGNLKSGLANRNDGRLRDMVRKKPAPGIVPSNAEGYYRFENNAPASSPATDPGFFKPGEEALGAPREKPQKELERDSKLATWKELIAKRKPKGIAELEEVDETVKQQDPKPAPEKLQRKIIRSGQIEFEIEAFDSTVARIKQIAGEEGGFVSTVNSQKLPNGKVRGTVVVRVPPERLDTLILKLRALGELKSQRIGSQDVTKQYFDIESRLRAARTMEERLLKIIKDGKGEIKDLLLAEKELGEWRTKIETLEGEIRYYNNLISLSTLTIALYEKEIRSPFAVTETERVEMGLEVEDVEKAHRDALTQVADAKGRVTKSELKQLAAGQFHALLEFETSPEAAGPLRDRLKQLGTVARLDVNRLQKTEGGTGRPGAVEIKRADTQFSVSIYNLANVSARETVHLRLAARDPEAAFKTIIARVEQAGGRVIKSSLNHQKNEQTTGTIWFEVKTAEAEAVLLDVRATGEVMHLQVTENPDSKNVTRAKRGFNCDLFAMGMVQPLETTAIQLASGEVSVAYAAILEAVRKAGGRVIVSQLNEGQAAHVSATLHFEVRREEEQAVRAAIAAAGRIASRTVRRASNPQNAVDSKTRLDLTIVEMASLPPTVTTTLQLAAKDVPAAHQALIEAVGKAKGWVLTSQLNEQDRHRVTATLYFDVPQERDGDIAAALAAAGDILTRNAARPQGAVRSPVAKSRYQLTLVNLAQVAPRENFTLGVEVGNVDETVEAVRALASAADGDVQVRVSRQRTGQDVASLILTVPVTVGAEIAGKIKRMGHVRVVESWKDPQVPDSRLALARLNVTLSNDLIVPSESSPWSRIKKGFSLSLQAGSWALMLLMIGLFFILPLALTCWGGWKVVRKFKPRRVPTMD